MNGPQVYALVDRNSNGTVDSVYTILSGMTENSVAWRSGSLFVAQGGQVMRYDDVDAQVLSGQVWFTPRLSIQTPKCR